MSEKYEVLGARLAQEGLMLSPADIHGMICGQLCANHDGYSALLTAQIAGGDAPAAAFDTLLNEMAAEIREQLSSDSFSFCPLLPDDDEDIGLRLYALGRWCEGFTLGYAAGCSVTGSALNEEAREVLADFARIAEIDAGDEAESDETEADYFEVVEYVRVATSTLYMTVEDDDPAPKVEPNIH